MTLLPRPADLAEIYHQIDADESTPLQQRMEAKNKVGLILKPAQRIHTISTTEGLLSLPTGCSAGGSEQ